MRYATPAIGWRRLWRALLATARNFGPLKLPMMAAGIAFYGILALFPALTALIALWSFVSDPAIVQAQLELARNFIPPEAYDLINQQITKLVSTDGATLGWASGMSLAAALWSARLGVVGLIEGLNVAYGRQCRSTLRQVMTAIVITLLMTGAGLAALAAFVVAPVILAFLPLGPLQALVATGLRWLIAVSAVVLALSVLYRYGPNRARTDLPWLSAGVVLAVVIWAGASWGLSFYLSNFGRYNEVYGTLGAVIALLMWLWFSGIAVLAGALLNARLEEARLEAKAAEGLFRPAALGKA